MLGLQSWVESWVLTFDLQHKTRPAYSILFMICTGALFGAACLQQPLLTQIHAYIHPILPSSLLVLSLRS